MGARLPSSDSGDIDGGDFDAGDHCSTEVIKKPLNVWHPSFKGGQLPPLPSGKTSVGVEYLAQIKAQSAKTNPVKRDLRRPVMLTCWKDTPQLYRRMVVAAAGLSADVVNKIDRDLSETEKVMIRAAVTDLRDHLNMLVSL
ncbi:MAG: hypothetical protein V4448_17625 [Pseudomonadota bacterium]